MVLCTTVQFFNGRVSIKTFIIENAILQTIDLIDSTNNFLI